MDYLQYSELDFNVKAGIVKSFKPYYKWITFNTFQMKEYDEINFMRF